MNNEHWISDEETLKKRYEYFMSLTEDQIFEQMETFTVGEIIYFMRVQRAKEWRARNAIQTI